MKIGVWPTAPQTLELVPGLRAARHQVKINPPPDWRADLAVVDQADPAMLELVGNPPGILVGGGRLPSGWARALAPPCVGLHCSSRGAAAVLELITHDRDGRVEVLATHRHYLDHLAPIWRALPRPHRGAVHVPLELLEYAVELDLVVDAYHLFPELAYAGMVVVASHGDLRLARESGRPVVYAEHGAGQSYGDEHPAYAGGRDRGGVVLILVPGPGPRRRNRERWPFIPCVEIGLPRLADLPRVQRRDPPVVAVSFHWDGPRPGCSRTWDLWLPVLPELARRYRVIGHGHPRCWPILRAEYEALGIEPVASWPEVVARADLYCCDNSSTIFEFAAAGGPVVLLNAPWYPRDAQHGLRFWSEADVGIQVDRPQDLVAAVARALADPPRVAAARAAAVRRVYSCTDASAAHWAAQAILEVLRCQ